jgi:signal transduction histidine kinase
VPSLFVIRGHDQGRRYELEEGSVQVGRDAKNVVCLRDTEVSRQHVEIRQGQKDGAFLLIDLGSSNGTYVNSQRVSEHSLRSGDRIQIGRTLMIYTGPEHDQSVADLRNEVDIVSASSERDESQIIKSLGDLDASFSDELDNESPWLARARSNLQVMYRTALAASHTMDIDELLARIMDLIFEWVEADRGTIMLLEGDSQELQPKVRQNRPGVRTDDKMSISQTILDFVMEKHEGVLTSDAQDDQRWEAGGSIVKLGVREAICVPMQGRYGVVGVIYIDTYTPPGHLIKQGIANKFNEEHLKLMIAIGHQAALAVEDTSYYSAMVQSERLAAIGQTIAGLSHHIKNILQGIRGGSYLIQEGLKDEEPDVVRRGWSIVERNQEKVSRLVLDMLTFSKERQPERLASELNAIVEDVVELMSTHATERGVALKAELDATIPTLTFDPEGLHHAILNVVTNGIDACEEATGLVTIATKFDTDAQLAQVTVTDNGAGITEEDQRKIFNLFESSKGQGGTGLGLSVSQKIMEEHGGEISVTSEPGQGSSFTLQLPAVEPGESSPEDGSSVSTPVHRDMDDRVG